MPSGEVRWGLKKDVCHVYLVALTQPPAPQPSGSFRVGQSKAVVPKMGPAGTLASLWGDILDCDWITLGGWLV